MTTDFLERLVLLKTSRTIKSTIAQRDGPASQNSKQHMAEITEVMLVQITSVLLCWQSLTVLWQNVLSKQTQNNVREISFEKVYSKTHKFILIEMKFASHFLHQSSGVKSAKHICLKSECVF